MKRFYVQDDITAIVSKRDRWVVKDRDSRFSERYPSREQARERTWVLNDLNDASPFSKEGPM